MEKAKKRPTKKGKKNSKVKVPKIKSQGKRTKSRNKK